MTFSGRRHRKSTRTGPLEPPRDRDFPMKSKLPIEVYLPLFLSAVAVLGVAPFLVLRLPSGEWVMATVDALIIIGFSFLGLSVLRPRPLRFARGPFARPRLRGRRTTRSARDR